MYPVRILYFCYKIGTRGALAEPHDKTEAHCSTSIMELRSPLPYPLIGSANMPQNPVVANWFLIYGSNLHVWLGSRG
ncbi:predicted protein [Sclerotinia sclerotiorum 1980 UF-70]|uniref:Uncharacterized protein n=1 Tax=Sclerotinia sclerotiorum (strain ATCC 18683 / 1980 / Ss-1) TaxID=665079 RepID=A7EM27_SCLS1|nr:predicted protein [Sclerotinia sclerotiorum 1980 UF-70]EDO03893.1 predicted protein [Sclerotinia sclerotiorum 1980 UF-70]